MKKAKKLLLVVILTPVGVGIILAFLTGDWKELAVGVGALFIMQITMEFMNNLRKLLVVLLSVFCILGGTALYDLTGQIWYSIPFGILCGVMGFPLYQHIHIEILKEKPKGNSDWKNKRSWEK